MSEFKEKLPAGERPPIRIVGKAPDVAKEHALEIIHDRFGDGQIDHLSESGAAQLKERESVKDQYVIDAIHISNEITNDLLRDAGLTTFDVPNDNIHLIDAKTYTTIVGRTVSDKSAAITSLSDQAILINRDAISDSIDPVTFMVSTIFHEMVHLKGYFAQEVFPSHPNMSTYRSGYHRVGLMSYTTSLKSREGAGYFEMYRGLNEAVVSLLELRYKDDVLAGAADNPAVRNRIEWNMSEEALQLRISISTHGNIPIEELLAVNHEGRYHRLGYHTDRRVLNYIADCAAEDNIVVSSRDQALDMFVHAHFTGRLKEIADLVDGTFGKKSFRTLKYMRGGDELSANQVMDDLMKSRRLLLAKRKKDVLQKQAK